MLSLLKMCLLFNSAKKSRWLVVKIALFFHTLISLKTVVQTYIMVKECEAVEEPVTREDPPHLGCSILSPLHAWDSISFLSACDSSERVGVLGDNQCQIGRKNTNPWGGKLPQTRTSVSCKHMQVSQSLNDFCFFSPFLCNTTEITQSFFNK